MSKSNPYIWDPDDHDGDELRDYNSEEAYELGVYAGYIYMEAKLDGAEYALLQAESVIGQALEFADDRSFDVLRSYGAYATAEVVHEPAEAFCGEHNMIHYLPGDPSCDFEDGFGSKVEPENKEVNLEPDPDWMLQVETMRAALERAWREGAEYGIWRGLDGYDSFFVDKNPYRTKEQNL